jgi:hypothetical protein
VRLIVCDRCRQEINGVPKTGYINLDKRDIETGELEGNSEFDEWDLCDDCLMQIRDFVHMAPLTFRTKCLNMPWDMNRIMPEEEPGQQAEEPIAPAQKEPPTIEDNNEKTESAIAEEPVEKSICESVGIIAKPKKPKAGTHPKAELMKEMARSGASLTEIMEVAGCSEPTARKYMKEAQDE